MFRGPAGSRPDRRTFVDTTVNRDHLAAFLRERRESLRPEDVGLSRGPRRRATGLRREEAAQLCGMSPGYLARLERGGGSRPSQPMAAAIARGLRLTPAERDHLFRLCGHSLPSRHARDQYVSPGLLRVMDYLRDTPAQVIGPAGETLWLTPVAVALLGGDTGRTRGVFHRWFTDPLARDRYFPEDHEFYGRMYVAFLRASVSVHGPRSSAASMVRTLPRARARPR